MASPNDRVGEYSQIDKESRSFDSESDLFIPDANPSFRNRQQRRIWKWLKVSLWIGQAVLFAVNIYALTMTMGILKRESAMNPMRAPIRPKTWTMFKDKDVDPYRAVNGTTNSKIDAKWNTLLDIGAVKMDSAARKRLPINTAQAYGEELYVGILEFEHQLHCLNRIRRVFYGSTLEELGGTESNFTGHNDHCFQYLRQTIMCHADVEVMSMDALPSVQGYRPKFNVVKQCRDFDLIHQWARGLPMVDQDAADGSRDPEAHSHAVHRF